jgi:hypothetical protein
MPWLGGLAIAETEFGLSRQRDMDYVRRDRTSIQRGGRAVGGWTFSDDLEDGERPVVRSTVVGEVDSSTSN